MLLAYGARDTTVDPKNTIRLAAAIRGVGGSVEEIVYDKQAHASVAMALAWPFRWLAPVRADVTRFFRSHLAK
jgi:hypothetical protein